MCRLVTEANIFKRISWDLQGKEQYCLGSLTKTLQMVGRVLEKSGVNSQREVRVKESIVRTVKLTSNKTFNPKQMSTICSVQS
jgi:hypothetical protein